MPWVENNESAISLPAVGCTSETDYSQKQLANRHRVLPVTSVVLHKMGIPIPLSDEAGKESSTFNL